MFISVISDINQVVNQKRLIKCGFFLLFLSMWIYRFGRAGTVQIYYFNGGPTKLWKFADHQQIVIGGRYIIFMDSDCSTQKNRSPPGELPYWDHHRGGHLYYLPM